MSRDGVLHSMEHSLSQLQSEAVDIVFLHDPTLQDLDQFLGELPILTLLSPPLSPNALK